MTLTEDDAAVVIESVVTLLQKQEARDVYLESTKVGDSELRRAYPNKGLVIFSDMGEATIALNREGAQRIESPPVLSSITSEGLQADLRGVEVYALGVDAAGISVMRWQELKSLLDLVLPAWRRTPVQVFASARVAVLRDVSQILESEDQNWCGARDFKHPKWER